MQDPLLKLAKARRAGGMTHVVEHLPSMLEALRSNLSTTKKRNKELFYLKKKKLQMYFFVVF